MRKDEGLTNDQLREIDHILREWSAVEMTDVNDVLTEEQWDTIHDTRTRLSRGDRTGDPVHYGDVTYRMKLWDFYWLIVEMWTAPGTGTATLLRTDAYPFDSRVERDIEFENFADEYRLWLEEAEEEGLPHNVGDANFYLRGIKP